MSINSLQSHAEPHLLTIDGLNLIRRVYGANPAPDSPEKAAAAIRTSNLSFKRALGEHRPTHCLWVFDSAGPNWRHDVYEFYKLGRSPMPEALAAELVGFKQSLADHGWAMAEYPGFEADDTMASAGVHTRALGARNTVLSTDKDMVQLLEFGIELHNHFERIAHDEAWCLAKFGVPPQLVADLLALWGDATDGIPGVDKVGVKTAAKLLLEHGSLDAVLAAAPAMAGALGKRLTENADIARLSRRLTELRFDVFTSSGHPFNLDELVLGETWDIPMAPRSAR